MIESGQDRLISFLTVPLEEEVPEGWKTANQIAKELRRSHCRVLLSLNDAVEKGLMETREFKIKLKSMSRPVRHYRLLKKKRK